MSDLSVLVFLSVPMTMMTMTSMTTMIIITMTTMTTNFALSLSGNKELYINRMLSNVLEFDRIFLLMIGIFLLENDLIKFNRKKSIQQKKTY